MKVYSIDPNTGMYFQDNNRWVTTNPTKYQGTYNYTPIYPEYTISATRFNYMDSETNIVFYAMVPINRFLNSYLVEVRHQYSLYSLNLSEIIKHFNNFCEETIKNVNVKELLKTKI